MMASATKFLFDYDFDEVKSKVVVDTVEPEDEVEEEPEIIVPSFSEEQLQAAKEEAFAAGKEEGTLEASTSIEQEIISSLKAMDARLTEMVQQQTEFNDELNNTAIQVATGVARKCFPEFIKQSGTLEIEGMIRELFPQIITEPRVVVHLNPEQSEDLKSKFKQIAEQKHYEGKLIIQEDTSVKLGECSVDWSHGRAQRNIDDMWQQIISVVERNLGINIRIPEFDQNESVSSEDQILEPGDPQTPVSEPGLDEKEIEPPAPDEPSEPPLVDQDMISGVIENAMTSLGENPLDTIASIEALEDVEAAELSEGEQQIELMETTDGDPEEQVELITDPLNPEAIDHMPEDAILEPDESRVMESSSPEESSDGTEDEIEPNDPDTTSTS